jgi:transposase
LLLAVSSAATAAADEGKTLTQVCSERDQYKKLYLDLVEQYRKLELGLLQKRERFTDDGAQLSFEILKSMGAGHASDAQVPQKTQVPGHERSKPTGRKPLPEHLPRVEIEVLPPEVEQKGRENFEKIGEDVSETIEHRRASIVVVRVVKPKFVAKCSETVTEQTVLQAPSPELPIERGLAGPGMLADTIVRRWQDHLPLHRLERIYGREGIELARSTVCGWHTELSKLVAPLIEEMWADAFTAPYLCTDATGVLVQAKEKCKNAHFFVVAAPEKHVLFGYTPKHNSAAVDALLGGYKGYLVADAHVVYDHLYKDGNIVEVGCWAHARRYFFKALASDPTRARHALSLIKALFLLEREHASSSPQVRLAARASDAAKIVRAFFDWCVAEAPLVLDETPISKGINYALNQRDALERFLADERLPLHNNFSERALRRQALGRKVWLFVGSDDGGEANANFVSLLASCQLHDLEPAGYLRDLFCLLPSWPIKRILELAPAYWRKTLAVPETQALLDANIYRRVSLGLIEPQRPTE